jgi:glucose dehydrogenase
VVRRTWAGHDNLYTCSVLALDPKTGKIKWHYQFSPNNPFDYDSVAEMVLATLNIDGTVVSRIFRTFGQATASVCVTCG